MPRRSLARARRVDRAPKDVLVATYRRPEKTLVIFSNLSATVVEFDLAVDAEKLQLQGPFAFRNLETNEELSGPRVQLPGYDFRMIEIRGKQE